MKVLVVGGGPAGLYAALLLKQRHPQAEVIVEERNRPDDTFGWGVALSDQTVANLRADDPVLARAHGLDPADPAAVFGFLRASKDKFR